MRDIHFPGRSSVHGVNGVAASSHPLATQAAIDVLKAGGNAIDASVAASAVLCVVEPMSTGIGGDCFVLYAPKGQAEIIGLNGSGRAPAAISTETLRALELNEVPAESVHSITIPGAIDAWCRLLEAQGSMEIGRLLEPAIGYAQEGFAISPVVSVYWRALLDKISKTAGGLEHWTQGGRAPREGEIFRTPGFAETLRTIAAKGRDGFYGGAVAQDMVACLNEWGGVHTLEDFAATACDFVTPIATTYGDVALHEIPPNGQGITALIMLNILSHFDLKSLDPMGAERIHLEMEAQRLAFQLRDSYVADMNFAEVPVTDMLAAGTAERLAARIDPTQAMKDVSNAHTDLARDTIYLNVIDRDCNAVSFINSVYMGFGSGFVSSGSGVTFQNRGAGFVVDPDHPNSIAGGKRPKHTIIPGMLTHEGGAHKGKVFGPMGVMGGDYQAIGHTHVVTNLVDYGMDPQEALDAPRTFYEEGRILVEKTVPEAVREELGALGHQVEEAFAPFGGGQVALINWDEGSFSAGSEPRKDGCALAY